MLSPAELIDVERDAARILQTLQEQESGAKRMTSLTLAIMMEGSRQGLSDFEILGGFLRAATSGSRQLREELGMPMQ